MTIFKFMHLNWCPAQSLPVRQDLDPEELTQMWLGPDWDQTPSRRDSLAARESPGQWLDLQARLASPTLASPKSRRCHDGHWHDARHRQRQCLGWRQLGAQAQSPSQSSHTSANSLLRKSCEICETKNLFAKPCETRICETLRNSYMRNLANLAKQA